jgi:hypothetical protein
LLTVAQKNGWRHVFAFKEGRLSVDWDKFQRLLALTAEIALWLTLPSGTLQVSRWVNGMSYENSDPCTHTFNALECVKTALGLTTR